MVEFSSKPLTQLPQTKLYLEVGRKAYSTKHLIQPAAVKPQEASPSSASKPPPAASPEWVDRKEMMRRLSLKETFFNELVTKRKIPCRKYSRKKVTFNPVAVEAALARRIPDEMADSKGRESLTPIP
jgi:hypothetical protein